MDALFWLNPLLLLLSPGTPHPPLFKHLDPIILPLLFHITDVLYTLLMTLFFVGGGKMYFYI